jgi:predicted mannosyl-3-phosphoglycerate phosphatase (HAD superfamily)
VTFDPFGDFATEGYLRNFEKEHDLAIVKRAENASFTTGLDEAFATLAKDAERNEVLGNTDEPSVKAQYEAMLTKRRGT